MNFLYIIILFLILPHCSFDNKSGIWKNENRVEKEENIFKEFKKLSVETEIFDKIIPINNNFKFQLSKSTKIKEWKDTYYNYSNNYINFNYEGLNKINFKSKKLSKSKINSYKLFEKNNMILSDQKGNLIIFSVNEKKIINKFNFYKNKYKKISIKINFAVDNNIIYSSDNLGYLYAFDYKKNKILWAKNYKIPFRSNLKIIGSKLIAANQNNNLFLFDKFTGDTIKLIPTEETIIKNQFINNLSLSKENLFFLNTYGSLYSINLENLRINWVINLNRSLDLNTNNLFFGNKIVHHKDKIVISANEVTYVLDEQTGRVLFSENFKSILKPIIIDNYLFLITENNLLISINLADNKIIYSYDINKKISDFLNIKKRQVNFKSFSILNNKIFIFLKNSYLLIFDINGELEEVRKLPVKLNTYPIFVESKISFISNKNKLIIIN
tara:strand:+ start:6482 stop:7804 length:1323 start_codon:yes stop_codon:yes gene_type:complete